MKRGKLLQSIFLRPYILAVAAIAGCSAFLGQGDRPVVWGVEFPQAAGELLVRPFLRWQLLQVPPLLFACEYLSTLGRMEVFIRIRVRNDRRMARRMPITCLLVAAIWGGLLWIIGFVLAPVKAAWLTIAGYILWMSVYLLVYSLTAAPSAAMLGVILLSAVVFCAGDIINPYGLFWPTSWGMAYRIAAYDASGIPASLALGGSLGVSTVCIVAAKQILQRRIKR